MQTRHLSYEKIVMWIVLIVLVTLLVLTTTIFNISKKDKTLLIMLSSMGILFSVLWKLGHGLGIYGEFFSKDENFPY